MSVQPQPTASMRRATRWLAEMCENAAGVGQVVDDRTVALFTHIGACRDCELREHNDPDLCPTADEIMDGPEDGA